MNLFYSGHHQRCGHVVTAVHSSACEVPSLSPFRTLTSLAIASAAAELLTFPLCSAKTIIQTASPPSPAVSAVIKSIYQTLGIRGFFQGVTPAITSQLLSTTSKFGMYRFLQHLTQTSEQNLRQNVFLGSAAGVAGTVLTHPFDVWKYHCQRSESFAVVLREQGYRVFYRGYQATVVKNLVQYAFLFPLQDFWKNKTHSTFISAVITSISVCLILHPLDYIKVHWSALHSSQRQPLSLRTVYRGMSLNLARVIPHFCITMILFEKLSTI